MVHRLVVFASDKGDKLNAILDACATGSLNAEVAALVAEKKCPAIHLAEDAGVPIIFHPWGPYKVAKKLPETYARDLAVKVWMYQPDMIVLAGWTRSLHPGFVENFPMQVVTTHPSLHADLNDPYALAHVFDRFQLGEINQTRVTAFYVSGQEVDNDALIAQETVPMISGEPFESFAERLTGIEANLLIKTIRDCLASPDQDRTSS